MSQESLSKLANWFYFETYAHGTYKGCKRLIFKMFPEYEIMDNWAPSFAEELYRLNCYSLTKRYNDRMEDFEEFVFDQNNSGIEIMQCLKFVQSWLYQSCEGDSEDKPLYKMMQKIENLLMETIINDMEEYKNARWDQKQQNKKVRAVLS